MYLRFMVRFIIVQVTSNHWTIKLLNTLTLYVIELVRSQHILVWKPLLMHTAINKFWTKSIDA